MGEAERENFLNVNDKFSFLTTDLSFFPSPVSNVCQFMTTFSPRPRFSGAFLNFSTVKQDRNWLEQLSVHLKYIALNLTD